MIHCEAEKEEMMMEAVKQRSKTYDLVYISILVVLITVCSWILHTSYCAGNAPDFWRIYCSRASGRKKGDAGCAGIYSDGKL